MTNEHEIDPETGLPIGPAVDDRAAGWPAAKALEGNWVRLEPLTRTHAADLFAASSGPGAAARFRYLFDEPPARVEDVAAWIDAQPEDRVGFAVVDPTTGAAEGRLFLMRIAPEMRSVEVGNILFGPRLMRTRAATEAIYLVAKACFEEWRYRRFEWKCDNLNAPSKRAAERFGFQFEGVFRRDFIVKGRSRDTAWYSMVDAEWPGIRAGFERWLDPANFDAAGLQRTPLRPRRGEC